MNQLSIIGNLTADPITKTVGDNSVCEFSIAYNEVYYNAAKQKVENVHFFNCVAWGKLGENIAKFFTKGQKIALTGGISQDRWEKDGEKRSVVKIRVQGFDFCGSKEGAPESGGQTRSAPPAKDADLDPDDGDDIPF